MRHNTMLACAAMFYVAANCNLPASDFPQAEISNGLVRATVYLPDARNGFYRGTRFDWSGMIARLEYKGHSYFGRWFDQVDETGSDLILTGEVLVSSHCTAGVGPAEEFRAEGRSLGWDAKPGGNFIKIGVGVLRMTEGDYSSVKLYEVVDPGRWTIKKQRDAVRFTHELADPSSGYGYVYRKIVRLAKGKPELVLEHRLKNTGRHTIQGSVYNHNFLVIDQQPPGPAFSVTLPYNIQSSRPSRKDLAEIRGNRFVFLKTLKNDDTLSCIFDGFSGSPKDNDIRIENSEMGAGVRILGDRPLSSEVLWSIRTVLAVEPHVSMTIEPGKEFTWKISYDFYTLPSKAR